MAQRSGNRGGTQGRKPVGKQSDLYNTGMPGDNPFQTMYQCTIGSQRAQTSNGNRNASQTPMMRSNKLEQGGGRGFGQLSSS